MRYVRVLISVSCVGTGSMCVLLSCYVRNVSVWVSDPWIESRHSGKPDSFHLALYPQSTQFPHPDALLYLLSGRAGRAGMGAVDVPVPGDPRSDSVHGQ